MIIKTDDITVSQQTTDFAAQPNLLAANSGAVDFSASTDATLLAFGLTAEPDTLSSASDPTRFDSIGLFADHLDQLIQKYRQHRLAHSELMQWVTLAETLLQDNTEAMPGDDLLLLLNDKQQAEQWIERMLQQPTSTQQDRQRLQKAITAAPQATTHIRLRPGLGCH